MLSTGHPVLGHGTLRQLATPSRPTRQLIAVVSNSQNGMNLLPRSGHFSHRPLSFLFRLFSRCFPFVLIVITPSTGGGALVVALPRDFLAGIWNLV